MEYVIQLHIFLHLVFETIREGVKVEMHGIQQLPPLLYTVPLKVLDEINLQHYEILVNELFNDVSNHIKNIKQEIPHHDDKAIKKKK